MSDLGQFAERLAGALGPALIEHKLTVGELTVTVAPDRILDVLKHLRDDPDCEFKILVDICGNDWPNRQKRFDVVYHFLSLSRNQRIRVKAMLGEGQAIPSCVALYPAAGWFEREAFDMYGIAFEGNPDLRRILTDYGFSGYPLRKDFPLTGFVELRYDEELKRVVYQPVQLVQEFRDFDFMSPWEGAPHILPGDEKAAMAPNATSGDTGKKP
ncbi:MAG TPA: NADH-quinone oxidoreductase subunit C [Rhizomicrobium sp.]|jgi:NADH-quinone oxidoreductase subunit C|nr:NADH-quinone oxidoreductase subunit C [Rhizomicrobium sp.]